MRGEDERSGSLFSYVDLEARVGKDHPLRTIRGVVNEALAALSSEFSALYSRMGRPSIPPEKLLRAMLLQAFYSIRSERQLMERLEFDLLFRWFVGIGVDDSSLGSLDVFQEPRAAAGGRHRRQAVERGAGAAAGEAAAQHGSFLGRRHADRSLGVDEELSAEETDRTNRRRPAAGGTARRISMVRSARTRRTLRRPIRRRGFIARGRARRPSSASWAMR